MEEPQNIAPVADLPPFKIPRKPIAKAYQPVESISVPKVQDELRHKERSTGATSRTRRWLKSLPDHSWLAEVTSLVVAWVAFVAIIVTLVIHQGRPIPQWPQLISINSLIAIFTAILKAALIMPVAEGELQSQFSLEPES